jgi:putative flippase GtrA
MARAATFLRSALTGGAATLVDIGVIAFAVGVLGASPQAANVPALLAGALVQFFGNRHFAFRAQGSIARQATLFAGAEAVALALNAALYHAVAVAVPLGAAGAVVARAVTTNLVFVIWSYPVWRRVFQPA